MVSRSQEATATPSADVARAAARPREHDIAIKVIPRQADGAAVPQPGEDSHARLGNVDARRAGHARPAEPAVTIRILRQVLLVVILGKVELGRRKDLGCNRSMTGLRQRALVLVARTLGLVPLRVIVVINPGAILRADIIPLAHALRRVVALPEC